MKRGKNYVNSAKSIDSAKTYDIDEAFKLISTLKTAKFDETVELHVRLGVDSRHADQQIRGSVSLPHGIGKEVKILAITKEDKFEEVKKAGASYVGGMDLIEKIQKENFLNYDVVVASPDMMAAVGRLGKILGPKGLMPSPKAGTVSPNVAATVKEIMLGKIEYRLDKTNIMHCSIGKISFGAQKLSENFDALMTAIVNSKPASFKGKYIKSCFTASTMGPSIRINSSKYV